MIAQNFWDESQDIALTTQIQAEVETAVTQFLQIATAKPESMFDYLYEQLPEQYQAQRGCGHLGSNV